MSVISNFTDARFNKKKRPRLWFGRVLTQFRVLAQAHCGLRLTPLRSPDLHPVYNVRYRTKHSTMELLDCLED